VTWSVQPTAAELDPVSRVTARMFVIAVGVVSVALSIGLSLTPSGREQISQPLVGLAAHLVLVASYAYFIRAADPFGPVISFARFQLFLGGIMAASVLNALSQFESDSLIRDDWGGVCLGLALILAAPYRRSAEIVWFTVLAVGLTFALAIVQNLSSATTTTLSILALTATTPAVAVGLGSAAYARSLVGSLQEARSEAAAERARHERGVLTRLGDTDAMGELGSLRRDVVPFLARLEHTGVVQPGDTVRAAELASVLRRAIVERISRGTLADVVVRYSDADRLAASLDDRQTAALRALIRAIGEQFGPSARPGLFLELREADDACGSLEFTAPPGAASTAALAPFLRMVRLVFDEVEVKTTEDGRAVTFRFDSPGDRAAVSWEM
jgi:hypothetical protein